MTSRRVTLFIARLGIALLAVAAGATVGGSIRVVRADALPPAVAGTFVACIDRFQNQRNVPVTEPCKPGETRTPLTGQTDQSDHPDVSLEPLQAQINALSAKVAALEAQVNQNNKDQDQPVAMPGQKGASKSNQANGFPNGASSKVGTKVTAPFFVTDTDGQLIMVVDAPAKGTVTGMTIYNPDGSSVQVGPGQSGLSGVRVYDGRRGADARAFMGMLEKSRPGVALSKEDGSLSSIISTSGDNAEMDFFNNSGKLAAVMGSNPDNGEGHAKFMDASGTPLALIGAAGTHGDVLLYGDGKRIPVWEFTLVGVR